MAEVDEKRIAPDSKLWAESLDMAQLLFFITVWNDGGMQGINELILFVSDRYQESDPNQRRAIAEETAARFFSEEAFDEFAKHQMRERLREEYERQARDDGPSGGGP